MSHPTLMIWRIACTAYPRVAEARRNEIRVISKGEASRRVIDAVRSRIPFYI